LGPGPRFIKMNLPGRGLTKFEKHYFNTYLDLGNGSANFLLQRVTFVIVRWFASRKFKSNTVVHITAQITVQFYNVYTIYKCGCGPFKTTWGVTLGDL